VPFRRAVAQLEYAEWLVNNGHGDEAEPLVTDARQTFERLKSRPWLERLQRVEPGRKAVLAETS
jgi:hypothetical protein